ncbi:MAG: KTSC domain-containing protein [Clostridiaceae bacterium]
MISMVPVSSSNLVAVGYDPGSNILRIQFHTRLYDYFGVPENIYSGLLLASSKGQYHHAYIKNSFRYQRIG